MEKLTLNGSFFKSEEEGLAATKLVNNNSATLEYLYLKGFKSCDFQFKDFPKLKKINLESCKGDMGLHSLLLRAINLEFLHLHNITLPDDLQINDLPKLTSIKLLSCRCTDGLKSLLSRAPNLKVLKLYHTSLDADAVAILRSNKELKVEQWF